MRRLEMLFLRIGSRWQWILLTLAGTLLHAPAAMAACGDIPTLQFFTGAGRVACPCFAPDERSGVIFTAPAADYPIEILRVGIGWGSQFGGAPSSLEEAIEIYAGGLPNPGTPIFTLDGPLLNDGAINQFDLEPLPGSITVNSGPFMVALRFLNSNAGNPFAPSVVHDGNGCQAGKNAVFAIPGGWLDACALGVSGDWLFYVVYRACGTTGVGGSPRILSTAPVALLPIRPNPSTTEATIEFVLAQASEVRISVHDLAGRKVAQVAEGQFDGGAHRLAWRPREAGLAAGLYFIDVSAGGSHARRSLVLTR